MTMIARISAADSMPTPSGGPLKSGSCRSQSGVATLELRGPTGTSTKMPQRP